MKKWKPWWKDQAWKLTQNDERCWKCRTWWPKEKRTIIKTKKNSHQYKDCEPTAPKLLPRDRTTAVNDIGVLFSNHCGPTQPEKKTQASSDHTQAPHKGQAWHGDARPMSPTSCHVGSAHREIGWGWEKKKLGHVPTYLCFLSTLVDVIFLRHALSLVVLVPNSLKNK